MAVKNRRMKAPEIQAPQTLEEAEALIGTIGRLDREVAAIENQMNAQLARIKEVHEAKAAPLVEEIEAALQSLQVFAEAHRSTLLDDRRKSTVLATGELGWRTSPPAVSISRITDVLEALKQLKLDQFIRIREEINKKAILEEPDAVEHVKGIRVTQKEEFWVRPFASEIERSRSRKVGR